jgi:predicted permease
MGTLIRRLRYWLQHRELDAALHEELEFHRALKQQELEAAGMSNSDAQLAARREVGNATLAREDARRVWIWPWLESVWQDTAYAVRSLRRQPGFTLVSVVVLGIAIGLNTSLFTVFAGLTLRPMSGLTEPDHVVAVSGTNVIGRGGLIGMSFPEFRFLASDARMFSGLVAERNTSVTLESGGVGRSTVAHMVTGPYFDVLGVRMEHGRGFLPDEGRRDAPQPVVVLSYALWQTRFGADPAIVGTPVRINDMPHTVVGIAPRDFTGSEGGASRVWLPLSLLSTLRPNDPFEANLLDRPQDCCVQVTGRLAQDVTREQARAELQVLSDRFRSTVTQDSRPIVVGGTQFLRGRRGASTALAVMAVLSLGLTLVLLIACANVGNLLLARAAARSREIGVRLSLGAGRRRIVRQLITEGFVLALIGSGIGVVVARWLPRLILNRVAGQPAPFDIDPDLLVLVYAIALAAISCLAFALAPALHATRCDVSSALKDGTLTLHSRFPLRSVLLGIQVAVTVILLTSAGLLLRGLAQARDLNLGFAVADVVVTTIELPQPSYDAPRSQAFLAELSAALRSADLPPFSFVSNEPLGDSSSMTGFRLPGESEEQTRGIEFIDVSPGFFDVLRIPIVAGRDFADTDTGRSVVIINESMARRYWPNDNPVGRSFIAGGRQLVEIVGIAGDAYMNGLDAIEPVYFQPRMGAKLLLRTTKPSTAAAVTAVVERIEPQARVAVTPLQDRLESSLNELGFAPMAASILGLFGLALATVGMFGVFAYVVRQRTREIGIRMALGAKSRDVVRLVLAGNSRAVMAGLGVGILGSLVASQILRSFLYGLSPLDPVAYGGVALLLTAAAAAASYIPARRAARINPTQALRCE